MKYTILKSRLTYNDKNTFITEIICDNLKDCKQILKKDYNLNPFYCVIINDKNIVQHNEGLFVNK